VSPEGDSITVMVVDDHPLWTDAVGRDLQAAGFSVIATAADGDEAIRRALATRPQVVLMDLQLPTVSGVEATQAIREALPDTKILVLSASGEQQDVLDAVKAGALGYLLKSARAEELYEAVRRTAAGQASFTPGLAGLLLGEYRRLATEPAKPERPELTDRETEVLRLIAKGLTAKQVATRLVLSHRTVQNHVQNAMGKLQVHNRAELVRYAIETGLDSEADPA
jgi:DNA-binding NarL/FixJ family response regulator